MDVSRYFLIIGTLYIIIGMSLGAHMGASENFTLAPVHAHINLLGFVVPAVFAFAYKTYPAMGSALLARIHFWMHTVGAAILLVGLYMLISGKAAGETLGPILGIMELLIILGALLFLINLIKNAR